MATEELILQIALISLGMVIFGLILNWIMGIKQSRMKEFQEKALIVQERMRNAQAIGDYQHLREIQAESIQLTKQMMVKQVLPLCIRCIIFLVIFAILGFVYADFTEWYLFYFIFSLLFSFGFFGLRYAYRRLTGKVDKRAKLLKEISGMRYTGESDSFQLTPTSDLNNLPSETSNRDFNQSLEFNNNDKKEKSNWKEKIEK